MTDGSKQADPSAIVIPFGKHKGTTVAELLVRDPAYAEWVTGQGWVAERFAELHAAILSRGSGTDDSPEHNVLQSRFLDDDFCLALVNLIVSGDEIEKMRADCREFMVTRCEKAIAEHEWSIQNLTAGWRMSENGAAEKALECRKKIFDLAQEIDDAGTAVWPVVTAVRLEERGVDVILSWGLSQPTAREHRIELKPSVGDDFPSVMRQMKRLGAPTLILERYEGRGVPEPAFRKMMGLGGMRVIFLQEVEEEMRRAGA